MTTTTSHTEITFGSAAELLRRTAPTSLAVVERTLEAGAMAPLHVHAADEGYLVVEGALLLYSGSAVVRLGAGDSFLAPAAVPHTHRAEPRGARFLTMAYTRSLRDYEDFTRAAAQPDGADVPPGDDAAVVAAIAESAGIEVLGPPGMVPSDIAAAGPRPGALEDAR